MFCEQKTATIIYTVSYNNKSSWEVDNQAMLVWTDLFLTIICFVHLLTFSNAYHSLSL